MNVSIIDAARAASLHMSVNSARVIYRRHRRCDVGVCVAKRWAVRVLFFTHGDSGLS